MASLDNLPDDQRAVLSLVLERGRGYDQIAQLLSIDRAAVRARALAAFDALGPQTGIDDQRRALITDYLLGQLPGPVAVETRDRLANSPSERAWARVVASELTPLAASPLPEIPAGASTPEPQPEQAVAPAAPTPSAAASAPADADRDAAMTALGTPPADPAQPPEPPGPRSSRLGGIIVLAVGALVVIGVVVVILVTSGGSSKSSSSNSTAASVSSSTTSANGSSTTSASTTPQVVAQINLKPPSGGGSAAGIAEVLQEGGKKGIAIVAQHMAPNTRKPPNAYAVWLYNSAGDAQLLGFVNPGVGKNGRLSTAGGLPANASHFHTLIVTLETKASPKSPGTIVLSGPISGL